ncbi:MAG: hypothetical protein QM755_01995 [Luteolibacter sp.]
MKNPLFKKGPSEFESSRPTRLHLSPDYAGKKGFALVLVLSMMVLILIVALGLLGLSTITLRNSGADQQMAVARANARLSLLMAIGELQKEAGPDQRITASAAVLDSSPETPAADGVAQEHLLGVWNAHTDWLNSASIKTSYVRGRAPGFRRWLVSGADPNTPAKLEYAQSPGGDIDMVGAESSRNGMVTRAGKVPVRNGAFAWWIGGENEKADLSLVDPQAGDTAAQVVAQANAIQPAISQVTGWKDFPVKPSGAARLVGVQTGGLLLNPKEATLVPRQSYHDLTAGAFGVLSNVRKGGLKKDLNLALEGSSLPPELNATAIRSQDPASLPAPKYADNVNFPTWNQLWQYYQLQNGRTTGGGLEKNRQPVTSYVWASGNLNATGYDRTPIVTRAMLLLTAQRQAGTAPGTSRYKMGMTPVLVVWNPFSAKLKCQPIAFKVFAYKLECRLYINNVAGAWQQLNTQSAAVATTGAFTLEPGETRIFSPSGTGGQLTPGFRTPSTAPGIDITPATLAQDRPTNQTVDVAIRLNDVADVDINGGKFQIYWTMTNANSASDRFNEMACNPCVGGQPLTIVSDQTGERFPLNTVGTDRVNMANFQFILKTGQDLRNADYYSNEDVRCKNFIHANPARNRAMMGSGDPAVKRYSQYMIWAQQGTGNELNPDWDSNTNRAYFGNGIVSGQGQTMVPLVDLSPVPVTSLAMLEHFNPGVGKTDWTSGRHNWEVAANQALAIGNSFAHPMIAGNSVYQYVPAAAGLDKGNVGQFARIVDQWDRGFLCNDGLWDDWFCSGIASQEDSSLGGSLTIAKEVDSLLNGRDSVANPRLMYFPNTGGERPDDARAHLINGAAPASSAWKEAARYMMLRGAFNVNSTSVEAWKAFLASSTGGSFITTGGSSTVPDSQILVSRFAMPLSANEGTGPQDPAAWNGVRYLTPAQIDRLARECVRQVKLRGPFLNLSDFVNRRLTTDETGVCGALQAAIDWDEFNGNRPRPNDVESINGRFKSPDDYIDRSPTDPSNFPAASVGSRYTGIPGYVTQADLLKRVGNGIAVRDDTFRIRGYGEAHDVTGKVVARAWCEAVVQRVPRYLDPGDAPESSFATLTSPLNKTFGRAFSVVSFRWLSSRTDI